MLSFAGINTGVEMPLGSQDSVLFFVTGFIASKITFCSRKDRTRQAEGQSFRVGMCYRIGPDKPRDRVFERAQWSMAIGNMLRPWERIDRLGRSITPPPMTTKRWPTTPHRQRSGSRAAANCTAPNRLPIQVSQGPSRTRRSPMALRADTWRCCSRLGVQSRKHG
jgi:hypothetical protein